MKISKKFLKGFTLIELLVVISIIGILATLITINYQSSRIKARDAKRKQDLATYSSALALYFDDYNRYVRAQTSARAVHILTYSSADPWFTQTELDSENRGKVIYLQQVLDDPLVKNAQKHQYTGPDDEDFKVVVRHIDGAGAGTRGEQRAYVFCRYAYYGGGAGPRSNPKTPYLSAGEPSIFQYTLSSCIENAVNRLSEQDGGMNKFRYEIGPGHNKLHLCSTYGAYGFADGTDLPFKPMNQADKNDCKYVGY